MLYIYGNGSACDPGVPITSKPPIVQTVKKLSTAKPAIKKKYTNTFPLTPFLFRKGEWGVGVKDYDQNL